MPSFNNILFFCFICSYFKISLILLAESASRATPEEVESQRAKLEENRQELDKLSEERKQVNDQHSREGDNDDPNEEVTGRYLEKLDELLDKTEEVVDQLI